MNKKILLFPVAILMATGLASCNKVDTEGHLVTYNVTGGVCVSSLSNSDRDVITNITVPNSINGKPVVEISKGAFKGCSGLRSISLPFIGHKPNSDGIGGLFGYVFGDEMYDGGGAFTWQCYGLGNRYDDGVTDYHEFAIPSSLHSVTITGGDYISAGAFSKCTSLRDITITEENKAIEIGNYAFYDCTSLKSFTIPSKIKTIGRKAFQRCYNLSEIIIPEGVTTVRHNAFSKCISAAKAVIPSTIDSMGKLVFEDFVSGLILTPLKEAKPGWDSEWANSTASIVYDYHNDSMVMIDNVQLAVCGEGNDKYFYLVQYIGTWTGSKILVPGTVTVNGITLPLKKIGSSVFMENTYAEELEIQEGVEVIGAHAFATCINLQKVSLPNSLKEIGAYAFYDCRKLGTNSPVNLNHVKKIDVGAFMNCYSEDEDYKYGLTRIDLGDSIEEIGESAFENDELLVDSKIDYDPGAETPESYDFIIPKSTKKIGNRAFFNTFKYALSDVTGNGKITFEHEGNEPCNLSEVGESAFELVGVSGRTKELYPQYSSTFQIDIDLGSLALAKIPNRLFYLAYLGDIQNFPTDTLTEVGEYAFYYIYGKSGTEINFDASVKTIGQYAFYNARSVKFNLLSGSSDNLEIETIGAAAFTSCYVSTNNKLVIPDSVETIGSSAFNNCTALKDIVFPINEKCKITRLESSVFASCTGLGKDAGGEGYTFNLPSTITYVGSSAFSGCTNLQHIVFNNENDETKPQITTVGSSAFNNCSVLVDVTFKGGLKKCTSFGSSVYQLCKKIKNPPYPPYYTSITSNAFNTCSELVTFDIPSTATAINERAFFNCKKLTTVTSSGTSVATIGTFAFASCESLKSVVLPLNVSAIADSAFSGCTSLGKEVAFVLPTAITVPWTGSKGMGANVFAGWGNSQTIYFQSANLTKPFVEGAQEVETLWGWKLSRKGSAGSYYYQCAASGSSDVHFVYKAPTI